jgi:predicted DCC family thiol-disulfide oxidoreductase YuxK
MTEPRLIVWYNTRCPVCDAGIDWQRNKLLAAVRAGQLSFRDINEQPQALAVYGASLDDVRRRLHATDESGRLIVGADVAIAIWRITPGEAGWHRCSAIRRCCRSRALPMIASRTCCLPGTGAKGAASAQPVRAMSLQPPRDCRKLRRRQA